ncbi:AAA family ATPase [Pseudomonas fluorescens]|uniref:AAA family ATPase n=1 Tax=Pseudomonas fluorescens TaxID=294 RepID=UPI00177EBEF1|nr:AAA family ATPase [Pseudomonas fluorescens]MBD8096000.1 AAA family ATPase [Pseudomonas fluorescens]MBD8772507.1 AAA family ATPase [Pseudomonas fluorescens]MBD8779031.1 AAA family ATPase [Pseudomonas fluorescens]MBD8795082.1 AAA family ATPase [Pseudomonas fluorescens]
MFTNIKIKNFKAFSEWQSLTLAPITLIYGPNSSGKSSIIHSIMLLKQSLTRPSTQGGLVSNGEYVDLGDFSSMVNGHDIKKDISFKLSYTARKTTPDDILRRSSFGQSHIRHYDFDYAYSGTGNNSSYEGFSYLKSIHIGVTNEKKAPIFDAVFNSSLKENSKDPLAKRLTGAKTFTLKTEDSVANYLERRTRSWEKLKLDDIKSVLKNTEFQSDLNFSTPSMAIVQNKPNSTFSMTSGVVLNLTMGEIASDLKEKFISVTYLGPLRSHPSRFYAPRGDQNESVGKLGENVARFIYEQSPEITKKINFWFERFEIPYELSARSIGDNVTGTVICLQLKDTRSNIVVGPSDVGFGIGQMLPIIVEGIVRDDSVICVEQPEIHLHPRLQAHLADFIIETSKTNQWIIETHSESLLLRLQHRIFQGLKKERISINYVEPTQHGGEIINIPLDEDGDFQREFPDGFFEERLREKRIRR